MAAMGAPGMTAGADAADSRRLGRGRVRSDRLCGRGDWPSVRGDRLWGRGDWLCRRVHDRRRWPVQVAGGDQGLITLEWLLVVGAVAGLAASTVLIVQQVVDDTSEVPADPLVRLIEADVEAAFVAADAQAVFDADPTAYTTSVDTGYQSSCTAIATTYDEVSNAGWTTPADPDGTPGNDDDVAAECDVTPVANLGG